MSTSIPFETGQDANMAALLILNYDVTEGSALDEYRMAATPILLGPHAGELLVSTAETVHLSEAPDGGSHTVVIRFRDAELAREIYDSGEYRNLLQARLAATVPHTAMIVPEL
ncbi:DUF1330 domain-containing protein [Streptomyces sp. ISL-99]|uniref:DUF1330 domain-containing protein n=1 Tax=Streptomyces sp. ISL-99 TaxID=2819193 RepID=UPI001BE9EF2F|nr:DUF1330 domain-containing protein [Streptomyces sp. ISL-99]MBT2528514.1 DUF1330 domain-containing protein [Streptomyces sp. ISL-99]